MFVVITRNFPPDIGGMQSLMEGLAIGLTNHGPVKVFADEYLNDKSYDQKSNLEVQRISGFKFIRKFRNIFFDHWLGLQQLCIRRQTVD